MKKIAILTAILASPAYAHQIIPETDFFKEAVKQNPLTGQVLAWCGLVGLNEEACKTEMYEKDGHISDAKIDSVAKCVDASGLKYRIAMDKLFKTDINKQQQFSHQAGGGIWHLGYIADKNDGTSDKPHRHFYTDIDIEEAANQKGMEFVRDLKEKSARDTVTETKQLSGTGGASAGVIIAGGTATVTKGSETSTEKAPVTQKEIDEAYAKGAERGRAHPESTSITPHGVCYQQGDCITPTKVYSNPEYPKTEGVAEGSTNPKPEAKPAEDPKPQKSETPKDDPFAPFSKESDKTGGVKTSNNDDDDVKGVTTPVQDPDFAGQMQQCVQQEENKFYKNKGSETKDQGAPTEEDKRSEADEKLKQGICDESFYGRPFCQDYKSAQAKSEDQDAEAKRKEAYDQALADFQNSGNCNAKILGYEFCNAAKNELNSERPQETGETIDWIGREPASIENPVDIGNGWEPMSTEGPQQGAAPEPAPDCERDMWGDCKI